MTIAESIPDIANAIMAGAALIVAILSLRKTTKFNTRQNEFAETAERLNKMLIERETSENLAAKRADLSANLYESGRHNYRLKVFNRGKGTARNVRLIYMNAAGETILIHGDITHKFPVPILDQHQSVELIAAIHMGSPLRAHIKLLWDDDGGEGHEKELTPSL